MLKHFKLFVFCGLFLFSCSKLQEKQPVIQVGDQIWSFKEIQDYMELRLADFHGNRDSKKIKEEILKEVFFYSLLKNWAEKNNILYTKKKLTKKESFLFFKKKKKLTALKIFKDFLNLKQALLKELEKKISKPSLKQQNLYYKKNKAFFFEPAQCQLQQIVVDSQKLALSLHKRISSGESFSDLNKLYSLKKDPGWVKKGQWNLFDKACFEEKSSLSSVLKSHYGWHIFLRTEKKASRQKSFSESQKQILKTLKQNQIPSQFQNWLKEESSKTPVFKDKKLLDQIKIQYKRDVL